MTSPLKERHPRRIAHARALADMLSVLERHHGTPCRDGLPMFAPDRRWSAHGINKLFSDREPSTVYAASWFVAREGATFARPEMRIQCDRCGHRLRVVDLYNSDKIIAQHQSTEKCLYRSILTALVWRGFAPVDGAPRAYTDEQQQALAVLDGPGNERTARRLWAPLPRVLALIHRRRSALTQAEQITDADLLALENVDTLTRWEGIALQWSANAVQLHAEHLHNATDVYTHFAMQMDVLITAR